MGQAVRFLLSGTGVRLSGFYAAAFLVIGVQQPFWPLWLKAKGLDAEAIGIALALSYGVKVLSTPLAAHLADRSGERRRPIILLLLATSAAFALFAVTDSFAAILAVSLVYFAVWPPAISLAESLTVIAAQAGGPEYGRVRLWGSLSFIAAAAIAGQVLAAATPQAVYWLVLAATTLALLAGLRLPDLRGERSRSTRLPLIEALRAPRFVLCLVACGLIQGSHAVYYGFGALHWQAAGYGENVIGVLWAEGVVAEVLLFAWGRRILARLSPAALIASAGLASAVRWIGLASTTELPALIALQTLHAVSFGAAHLGAMHYIAGSMPPQLSATAQSLYSGVVWGLFFGVLLFAAGGLYAQLYQGAYWVMAGVAVVGGLCAWVVVRGERQAAG